MSPLLTVKDLQISLKKPPRELVSSICFSLLPGQSVILLGQSGSGKTMTCRAVMGLLDPKRFVISGSIRFNELELTAQKPAQKRRIYGREIAFIPQNPMTALDPSMRIGRQMDETLSLHTVLSRAERRGHVLTCLAETGLPDPENVYRAYPYMLSGGMLQRVLIAMASMVNAKLVIADEPTTALDAIHRNETIDAFCSLRNAGAGIFMVTHDFTAATQLGGKLMVMKDGQIIEQGDAATVLNEPHDPYTRSLIAASALSRSKTGGAFHD